MPDPDAALVPLFKQLALENEDKSRREGRPIFDDLEVVEIRTPGSRDVKVFPATAVSHWEQDAYGTAQRQITYAERFRHQYNQFKAKVSQTKSGTPVAHAPFLTAARAAELNAMNIYTVEALALIDGAELRNLGMGGRELKNQAQDYITTARAAHAPDMQQAAELEAMRAQMSVLMSDNELLKQQQQQLKADAQFELMSIDGLREYIEAHTGEAPRGSLPKATLVRMAADIKASKNEPANGRQ